jgi:Cof subfamily protein (haloacid dehalogenase superfamily)
LSIKLIVLDLDDTLLRDDHSISNRTKVALMKAQENGVKVALASGRSTFGMVACAEELSLAEYGGFILSFNGGKIINYQLKEELFSSSLPLNAVKKLYEISQREGVFIHTYVGNEIITETDNPYTTIASGLSNMPINLVTSFVEGVKEEVGKVLMCGDPDKMKVVEAKLKTELADDFSVMRSKPFFVEFTEKGVTKGTSLSHLIRKFGIKREEVLAIGDSYNDHEMITFAGLGVAMGNAPDDIKVIADHVTDTNMNDGVAKTVEEFVLRDLVKNA